jgi:hypothetical protein
MISLLEGLRPMIKQRWEALLRAEPIASPLANPDTLVFLMDETLQQIIAALRTRSVKLGVRHVPTVIAPLQGKCACGINPLLAYYTTGRYALREVAEEKMGQAFSDVLVFFHRVAQKDIEALCGVCCNQGAEDCSQRRHALTAANHASLLSR